MFKNLLVVFLLGLSSVLTPVYPNEIFDAKDKVGFVSSSVKGLTLPEDQTVKYDEGFVSIKATCIGEVRWLVLSQYKIKYIVVNQSNSIIVSIPPDVPKEGGIINIFAVGLVSGSLTDFARTNIIVTRNNPGPTPVPPGPGPLPPVPPNPPVPPVPPPEPVVHGKLHLTFLIDVNSKSTELVKLVNSETLRKGINDRGHWFRLYDIKSDVVSKKNLTEAVLKVGGNSVLAVQSEDGQIVTAVPIPRTEEEIFNLIKKLTGK